MAQSFGIGREIPFPLHLEYGRLPDPDLMSQLELGESAIGQGRVLTTPLNMALVAAAVANGGKLMAPTLVDEVRTADGLLVKENHPQELGRPIKPEVAALLKEMMVAVVREGTGQAAAVPNLVVAGKTGSAENPHGPAHAWFIGFAPVGETEVAIAVIVENGGAGGTRAAPIAREMIKTVIAQRG
jgi:peptidoglycan glycosyltransferase